MKEIVYILLFLGILGLISFLLTKLIIWILPYNLKNKKSFTIIYFAITLIQIIVIMFFPVFNMMESAAQMDGRRILDKFVEGKIAYHVPDTMDIAKSYKAIASVSKSQNDSILFQDIDSIGYKVETIRISSRVKMVLIDPTGNKNFQITPLNTEEQLVDDSTNTIWKWNVIPIRSGENELILRATVKVLDELGENYKDIPVFEKHIKVNASVTVVAKQFIGDYWQWLSTAIIIPLIVWGYRQIISQKKVNKKRNQIGF